MAQVRFAASAGEQGDGAVLIHVSDNGIGIPDERGGRRVFDDFYRAEHREKDGRARAVVSASSICRKIMEAHGGSIRVADTSPEGTTFELCFPPPKA